MMQSQEKREPPNLLDKVARRAQKLLEDSPTPLKEMAWAERRLSEAGLFEGRAGHHKNPRDWTQEVLAQNPDLTDQSLSWVQQQDSHPEKAQTFESLILDLIPSEGGL